MTNFFKICLPLLIVSASANVALSFSYTSSVHVLTKQNGVTKSDYTSNFGVSLWESGFAVNRAYADISSFGKQYFAQVLSGSWRDPGATDSAETDVTQTIRFTLDAGGEYPIGISGEVSSLSPNGFAEARLIDEATGEIIADTGRVTSGLVQMGNERQRLKANHPCSFVSRAYSFINNNAPLGGWAEVRVGINTSPTVVPEPATMSLLLGVGALALRKRRRS